MKFKIMVGSLVLGLGLCTQSFAFDLLDRMLGINGCGCNNGCAAKSCCEKPAGCAAPAACVQKPSCVAPAPTCAAPAPTCGAQAPTCGAQAPSCGADHGCKKGCKTSCCRRTHCNNGCKKCDSGCGAAPTCGAEKACNKSCCKSRCRTSLLDRLMSCNSCNSCKKCDSGCHKGCAAPSCGAPAPTCGCNGGAAQAEVKTGTDIPAPPAPVVDPSAFVPTQRRVVQASASLVR